MCRLASPLCVVLVVAFLGSSLFPQGPREPESGQRILLVKLAEPVYPQMAQTAHVTGTVEVEVRIRQDGAVESATPISGPPMLQQSAVDSARNSQFECRQCSPEPAAYTLAYTFRLVRPDLTKHCSEWEDEKRAAHSLEVDAMHGQITLTEAEVWTCDPVFVTTRVGHKVRSAKCLWLWKCGVHWDEVKSSER